MTAKPGNYQEITGLISALLEGRLSEPERVKLETLLKADPQARRLYMQMVDQELELSCLLVPAGAGDEKATILPLLQPEEPDAGSLRRRRWWRLAAAAAVLLIGFALALLLSRNRLEDKIVHGPKPATTAPLLSESWSEDFEQGTLRGWTGALTSNDLPPDSRFGITAVTREYPNGEIARLIQLPEDWREGLFALTAGSMLHVSFRVENRAHINVFMHTIPNDPNANGYEMYQFEGTPFQGRTGEWRTASIPFSKFVRKIVVKPGGAREFVGGPPSAGERVTTLSFASVENIDLVIDRVWVTSAQNSLPP